MFCYRGLGGDYSFHSTDQWSRNCWLYRIAWNVNNLFVSFVAMMTRGATVGKFTRMMDYMRWVFRSLANRGMCSHYDFIIDIEVLCSSVSWVSPANFYLSCERNGTTGRHRAIPGLHPNALSLFYIRLWHVSPSCRYLETSCFVMTCRFTITGLRREYRVSQYLSTSSGVVRGSQYSPPNRFAILFHV